MVRKSKRTKARTKPTAKELREKEKARHLKYAIKTAKYNAEHAETSVERQRWLDTAEQLQAGTYVPSPLKDDAE